MAKLRLHDLLDLTAEQIIEKANLSVVSSTVTDEREDEIEETIITVPLKTYRALLFADEIVLGKKFRLNDGYYVEIIDICTVNNRVLARVENLPYLVCKMNLYKLSKESNNKKHFPYEIGEEYIYSFKGQTKRIKIHSLNPAQNAVSFIDENGEKKFARVSKLTPVTFFGGKENA